MSGLPVNAGIAAANIDIVGLRNTGSITSLADIHLINILQPIETNE